MVAQGAFQDPLRLRVSLMGAAPCRRAAICQAVSVPSKETGRQPHSPSLIALPVKTELGQAARLRAAVSSAASQTRGQAPLSCGVPGAIALAGAPPVNSAVQARKRRARMSRWWLSAGLLP